VKNAIIIPERVLVTGANGFVGRSCCEELLAKGWRLRAVVRPGRPNPPPAALDVVEIDSVGAGTDWSAALRGVSHVVHLAGRAHVLRDLAPDSLVRFMEINVAGTACLAQMAAQQGVRRLVYLSTVKVHGEGGAVPYREDDQPSPSGPYAVSKWQAEQALRRIAAETGLEVVILRPPLIYGPGVKANFLAMMKTVQRGMPLPFATISNRRSLLYVGNLMAAVGTCLTHPRASGETYLVSDGEDVSTPELIRRIAAAMKKPPRLFPFPPSLLSLLSRLVGRGAALERLRGSLQVDIGKIWKELGWTPPVPMNVGLVDTVRWYQRSRSFHGPVHRGGGQ
jgi:nucleoside-diphosphate-sugar epimerase